MAELDLGKVVMDSYNDLDNKPKINEVELSGNKTLEDLGIQQLIDAVNVSRLSKDIFAPSFETLEDFVAATATDVSVPHFGRMYINTRNWGFGTSQIRYLITYMRAYTEGVLDVLGSGIFWDDTNTMWHVEIHGKIGELYIQHYKIEPNQIPTNNLLATVAGTPLDAVQGKVLYDRQNNLNVARKTGKQYNTLEEFVEDTATEISIPNIGRFKDLGGFVRGNVDWYRYVIVYQNPYAAGSASSISGNGILWDGSGTAYKLYIKGNKDSGVSLTLEKLATETESNNGLTSIKVYSNTDFQTVANSVPINKKLTCRMLGSGNSPVTGLPLNQLFIVEIYAISEATAIATAYAAESGNMYVNRKSIGNWQGWVKKTDTVS